MNPRLRPALLAALLFALPLLGVASDTAEALPGPPAPPVPLPPLPFCPLGPNTDPPVCVPAPPPPPDPCQALYDLQRDIDPNPGLVGENCHPYLPECGDVARPIGPLNPCEPSTECQDYLGPLELDPDPCEPPSCETLAANSGAMDPEGCTPPTCGEVMAGVGADSAVAEAACDTAKLPVCQENPGLEGVEGIPVDEATWDANTREADCLPCVGANAEVESCADLCLSNEVADCLVNPPGCENVRSILGGSGELFLDESCVPQAPLCNELGMSGSPPPNTFAVDCLPDDLYPTCGPETNPALPVTPVIFGNGDSYFQLFQEPTVPGHESQVYVSFRLQTNNIGNGANDWVFGWELRRQNGGVSSSGDYEEGFGDCKPIGNAPGGFSYYIDAGAGGWELEGACTVTFTWSISVGVEVSMLDTTGSASTTLGGSISCMMGGMYDTESLLRGSGYT